MECSLCSERGGGTIRTRAPTPTESSFSAITPLPQEAKKLSFLHSLSLSLSLFLFNSLCVSSFPSHSLFLCHTHTQQHTCSCRSCPEPEQFSNLKAYIQKHKYIGSFKSIHVLEVLKAYLYWQFSEQTYKF